MSDFFDDLPSPSEEPETIPATQASGGKVVKLGFARFLFFLLVLALAIGGTVFLAKTRPELLGLSTEPNAQAQREVQSLVEQVGEIMQLPEDEAPTVATVTDLEAVKDQDFFKNAQNGDKVLVYVNAKRAILYRPSEKKIIEVGNVNINQQGEVAGEASPSGEQVSPGPEPTPAGQPTPSPTPGQ